MNHLNFFARASTAVALLALAATSFFIFEVGTWFWVLTFSHQDALVWAVPITVAAVTVLLGWWRSVFDLITVVVTAIPIGAAVAVRNADGHRAGGDIPRTTS
jgi:hypothetical protein